MTPKRARPQNVTAYIDAAPKEARKKLREMRSQIRASAPGAKESLKWGMPAYSYRRILVMFGGFKHHIGFFPTAAAMKAFAKDLSKFTTGRGSIRFPLEKPLPLALIHTLVAFRVRQSIEKDGKWRTGR
jgi:uncharacterized protein YdhG (YjbR/CyaY superfamily)